MKLIHVSLLTSLVFLFSANAFAGYSRCRWSVETLGETTKFSRDPLYKQGPKMIAASACSDGVRARGITIDEGAKPVCTGYLYCESEQSNTPPAMEAVACFAEKTNGKWRCPKAMDCVNDETVMLYKNPRIPAPVGGSGQNINQGGGSGMPEAR